MKTIRAVVGVLRNKNQEILITKRQANQFMAGFWELPGGKTEPNESPKATLTRELQEELGIQVQQLSLHQTMLHQYPDRTIQLSIYHINQYQNTPTGIEGQTLAWVKIPHLATYKLLPTMRAFIHSITLPNQYWITPVKDHYSNEWMTKFEQKLIQGIQLIQLRSKTTLNQTFIANLHHKCQQHNTKLLLNTPNKTFTTLYNDGYHLTTAEMHKLTHRPCAKDQLLGVSTHNLSEALQAQTIGADFIVISPVQHTQTHPNTPPIGWDAAKQVVDKLNIPVYFLGGMREKDLPQTLKLGAQGIAGVSTF
ncbi:Mutator mutT protein (7,8-dihydro-8-oxoguanine-triphosphatase) / Thiamin-phosphate pyrophosphorylase-like protein [hydrothermal vent metagenome]|uniref:8-oxo-dGTP diphosphatase n=1 Tax=hydrothermal vent metagenome TaxID=652676 RepID=A0A1W1E306_9ZZZZ